MRCCWQNGRRWTIDAPASAATPRLLQVRKLVLPNSGLDLWLPRFVIAPPGGAPASALLEAQAP